MKISELCYALQKISETEGDLEIADCSGLVVDEINVEISELSGSKIVVLE